ncbi:MAG TPA: helix-turn-helix transcriptional regulator [Lachnospiraceae bacterium]|nr:helix-turn-helix transcriptional regulator [Lachnospiraceae bacterium]
MEFQKKLYELRKQKGISQEELADKLNVTRQTVSKWELGDSTPDLEKLRMLSDFFDISLDELVMGKEVDSTSQPESSFIKSVEYKVFTVENKKKMKRILRVIGVVLLILLAVDFLSMIIYFSVNGIPK